MDDALLTPAELAALLTTHPRTLEAWRYRGVGPAFIRLSGRAIRYRRGDVERWLNGRRFGDVEQEPVEAITT